MMMRRFRPGPDWWNLLHYQNR